jgi:hypothetical protein
MKKRGFLIPLVAPAYVFSATEASASISSYSDPVVEDKNTFYTQSEGSSVIARSGDQMLSFC